MKNVYECDGVTYERQDNGEWSAVKIAPSYDEGRFLTLQNVITVNGVDEPVTSIADNAAVGCDTLVLVSVPKNIKRIGVRAFATSSIKQICSSSVIEVGKEAFMSSALEVAVLLACQKIGASAFKHTSLREILDYDLYSVGNEAFAYTSLECFNLGTAEKLGKAIFKETNIRYVELPHLVDYVVPEDALAGISITARVIALKGTDLSKAGLSSTAIIAWTSVPF